MSRRLTVEADGGSRGNPGVAGYGALVRDTDTGALLAERAEPLGTASNNVAEYRGLIAGLTAARAIDPGAEVLVRLDSKLVVEQMAGRWKIKHEDMRRLALQAREVVSAITEAGGSVRYEWVPRADNTDADALSNDAMDGLTIDRRHEEGVGTSGDPVPRRTGTPVRVVLVASAPGPGARAAASAVGRLLGGAPRRLVTAPGEVEVETAAEIGEVLGVEAVVDAGWSDVADVADGWTRVLARGGTTVLVCPPEVVRAVLGHVLGVPPERQRRIAVAAGSLAGVEVFGDDDVSVAFTNRT